MSIPVLFTLNHPNNAKIVQVLILKLCAFDFFQTEKFYEEVLGLEKGKSFSAIFDQAGLEGHNFIIGIGPVFFYFLLFPIGILLHQISRRRFKNKKILESFNKEAHYTLLMVQFIYASCFELAITACISISQLDSGDFKTFWSIISISLALVTFFAFIITPIFIFKTVIDYYNKREDEEYQQRYKELFDGLETGSKLALNYPNFFLIRRYVIMSVIVFMWDRHFQLIQINGFIISTLAFMFYLLHV